MAHLHPADCAMRFPRAILSATPHGGAVGGLLVPGLPGRIRGGRTAIVEPGDLLAHQIGQPAGHAGDRCPWCGAADDQVHAAACRRGLVSAERAGVGGHGFSLTTKDSESQATGVHYDC